MYDYLAKIILLGPSGSGKFVHPFLHLSSLSTLSISCSSFRGQLALSKTSANNTLLDPAFCTALSATNGAP
jgi:hypothetical protein